MADIRSGILLVAKPAGVTSHDVVERVRKQPIAGGGKVGHAGTLDPFATGLLIVLVGQATRFQQYLMGLPKEYLATAQLGAVSDSGDPTGTIGETGERTSLADVRAGAAQLVGEIRQKVPLTSAVKVGGERLYRKARRGEHFETPSRVVNVGRLDVTSFDEARQRAVLEIECSSGTYVRQLVADLGALCGTGAYCAELERTAIGPFRLDEAGETRLVALAEALSFLPERVLDVGEVRLVRDGRALERGSDEPEADRIRLTAGGELVAVAEPRDGVLKPVTVISRA
jgi:tRNA pseudouridine55 synthase